jgi:hypothetical protein
MGRRKILWISILICNCIIVKGQNPAVSFNDTVPKVSRAWEKADSSTWKDTRLINTETTKTPKENVMVFRITHRFGNVANGGGFQTLFGFDAATDINLSFEYGITNNLEVGIGRSSQQELVDGMVKYRFLTQNSTTPVSFAFYEDAGITPELNSMFYEPGVPYTANVADRFCYFSQLILDRKFNKYLSLEIFGGLSHRNYVYGDVNTNNGTTDENNLPFLGAGGRIRLSKHAGIVFDYFYTISKYRTNNRYPYSNPLSIGYEIETGGHVFEINLSNASFINENNIIPNTLDSWGGGGFKLGFSISRLFNL